MSRVAKNFRKSNLCDALVAAKSRRFATMWWWLFFVTLATLIVPISSFAESRADTTGARASIDFRIVIPAMIRVTMVTQPDNILIEDRHIAQGYIDLDAGTSVKLTSNTRDGYLLAASYDSRMLSSVEVRVSSQNLMASMGFGSMRVASGLTIDKLIPISYRLHLLPEVRAGQYRWPVALAFSLAAA